MCLTSYQDLAGGSDYGFGINFVVYKTYEYVLFSSLFFAESLTAMHPGGSEVEGPF